MYRYKVKTLFHLIWNRDINQDFLNLVWNFQESHPVWFSWRTEGKKRRWRKDL